MTASKIAQRRALMRRLWNDGDSSHADIAAAAGLSVDTVANWLASQPGYPGIITPKSVVCAICGVAFPSWRQGGRLYCSMVCRQEGTRQRWFAWKRRDRGLPAAPPPPRRRLSDLSQADRRVVEAAVEEARERGTTREAVLAEWKFEPQRNTA
jgi:hypothetical protein